MHIWLMALDSASNSPIVVLKEIEGEGTIPIWIGLLEGVVIAGELQGMKISSRPMTHDLLKAIIQLSDATVKKVVICDLKDGTYYALVHLMRNGREITLDARPSDAIALSLKVSAPIFAEDEVIRKSKQVELKKKTETQPKEGQNWQDVLENMKPEDFGKYKM
jgi:bifunctional DNase/RNase